MAAAYKTESERFYQESELSGRAHQAKISEKGTKKGDRNCQQYISMAAGGMIHLNEGQLTSLCSTLQWLLSFHLGKVLLQKCIS